MPSIFTPTTPTFISDPIPPTYAVSSLVAPSLVSSSTLDLKTKFGAWIYTRIGRVNYNALTNNGYVAIRSTDNSQIVHSGQAYDRVSGIAAATATTLSGGTSIGATSIPLTSASGFSAGDNICLSLTGSRIEFLRILSISGSTAYLEFPAQIAHNSADNVVNQADIFDRMWLPGGDVYLINYFNNSGQPLIFHVAAATYDSDQAT